MTPTLQWSATTLRHASLSLIRGFPHQKILECVLLLFGNPGNLWSHGKIHGVKKKKVLKKSTVTIRPDSEGAGEFASHLSKLIDSRVNHVRLWLDSNLQGFPPGHTAIDDLRRRFDSLVIKMKTDIQLCGAPCASCHFLPTLCSRSRSHNGDHSCQSSHNCVQTCSFCTDGIRLCGLA